MGYKINRMIATLILVTFSFTQVSWADSITVSAGTQSNLRAPRQAGIDDPALRAEFGDGKGGDGASAVGAATGIRITSAEGIQRLHHLRDVQNSGLGPLAEFETAYHDLSEIYEGLVVGEGAPLAGFYEVVNGWVSDGCGKIRGVMAR